MKILKLLGRALVILVVVGGAVITWQALRLDPDVEPGTMSPDVAVTTLDGEALALSSLRGKVVLLDFWGST